MPDFVLKSGAKLTVSMSPFKLGNDLKKACKRAPGDLQLSDEVENLFFLCAQKAIYEGLKVNEQLFDDTKFGVQARGDYEEIFEKVLEVNLAPFFPKASSLLSTSSPKAA